MKYLLILNFVLTTILSAQPNEIWGKTRGNLTRSDKALYDDLNKKKMEIIIETSSGVCIGGGVGVAGIKGCVDDEGAVGGSVNAAGVVVSGSYNYKTKVITGCAGVGGEFRAGAVGVGVSGSACIDSKKEFSIKTTESVGPIQLKQVAK